MTIHSWFALADPVMTTIPYGSTSSHILASNGPETYPMDFYSTTNSVTYGLSHQKFIPRRGRHKGTGYSSNFRPVVFYSSKMDDVDDPAMKECLKDNLVTTTTKDYRKYPIPKGTEPLPMHTVMYTHGREFGRDLLRTLPISQQINSVHYDTKPMGAPSKHVPLLHVLSSKDPVKVENFRQGPKSMSTEQATQFQPKPLQHSRVILPSESSIKEYSGFSHAVNDEPITYRPSEAHTGQFAGGLTWRPTGTSIMQQDFFPHKFQTGKEPLPAINVKSQRDNGYTAGNKDLPEFAPRSMQQVGYTETSELHPSIVDRIKKKDPTEYVNIIQPNNKTTLKQNTFYGEQRPAPSISQRLARDVTGNKELSGYAENHAPYTERLYGDKDPEQFQTYYGNKYGNPNPVGKARMGNTSGGVQDLRDDGYVRGTLVHKLGKEKASSEILQEQHPYVAKSMLTKDLTLTQAKK